MLDKIRKNTYKLSEFVRVRLSQVTTLALKLAGDLFSVISGLSIWRRVPKKPVKFVKRYSLQISFGIILALFLTISVGEGQAYQVGAADFSTDTSMSEAGFIGKPQVLGTQTILTGEVTQVAVINYTVEKGDTVLSIANRYNLSVGSLLDANSIKAIDATKIKPGDNLVIPADNSNTSLAWLDEINQEQARQAQLAATARQKQLAQSSRSKTTSPSSSLVSYNGSYQIIGKFYGSYNGGLPGWCTWWVHKERPDLPNGMGNARDYLNSARAAGMSVSSSPQPGDVGVDRESVFGHVFYVESVSGGMMTITEMNYAGRYLVDRRTVPIGLAVGFIHHS